MKSVITFMLCLLLWGISTEAQALCVQPLCSCDVTSPGVSFGTYNPLPGTRKDVVSSVRVSCSGPQVSIGLLVPIDISFSVGQSSTNYSQRYMSNGTNRLYYNLYSDSARTVIWGNATSGTSMLQVNLLLALGPVNIVSNIYGTINAAQKTVRPGSYTDTITMTVTYY